MLQNSTVKIILGIAIVILIVAATFAYGNSQRQSQLANKDNEKTTTSQSASPSSSVSASSSPTQSTSPSPTPSASSSPSPSASASPSVSAAPSASTTPQVTPASGSMPATGSEWIAALPVVGLGVLLYTRRNSQQAVRAAMKNV